MEMRRRNRNADREGEGVEKTRGNDRMLRKCVFGHVTVEDIEKKIDKIDDKPSSSTCGISYEVIKKMKKFVKKPIQQMTNLSMDLKHFPNPSKHGLIKPLYKGEPKKRMDPEAYRPVNILLGPGIIMDMCTSEQQTEYAEQLGVIPRECTDLEKIIVQYVQQLKCKHMYMRNC
jgi:hypothetical protein